MSLKTTSRNFVHLLWTLTLYYVTFTRRLTNTWCRHHQSVCPAFLTACATASCLGELHAPAIGSLSSWCCTFEHLLGLYSQIKFLVKKFLVLVSNHYHLNLTRTKSTRHMRTYLYILTSLCCLSEVSITTVTICQERFYLLFKQTIP